MQGLQNEYSTIVGSPKNQNSFCQILIEMAGLESKDSLPASIQYYDDLKDDNSSKLKILFDDKLTEMIDKLKHL